MTSTALADPSEYDPYLHILCALEGRGLCGQRQEEIEVFADSCSVCQLITELQPRGVCPLNGAACGCF